MEIELELSKEIEAVAEAEVPYNIAGGPYRENGYTKIPVKIGDFSFVVDLLAGNIGVEKNHNNVKEGIKHLQEVWSRHDLQHVQKGSLLILEFDNLGGVGHWAEPNYKDYQINSSIRRTEPYAIRVRYIRKEPVWQEGIFARAHAVVPVEQPGGPYRDGSNFIIPVKIEDIKLEKKLVEAEGPKKMEERIKSLDEVVWPYDIQAKKGFKLKLEFDLFSLIGCHGWNDPIKLAPARTTPYMMEVRYERPKEN